MKKSILFLLFFISLVLTSQAQCTTYVQMVLGVESCLFPRVVSTQQLLLPCSTSPDFNLLAEGDYAYINYIPSSCVSLCMSGTMVDITCFNTEVGIDVHKGEKRITIYPNPATHTLNIDGLTSNFKMEVYDVCGCILPIKQINIQQLDLSSLTNGLYFIKLFTEEGTIVRKFVKK